MASSSARRLSASAAGLGRGRPALAEGCYTFVKPPNNHSQGGLPPRPIREPVNRLPHRQSDLWPDLVLFPGSQMLNPSKADNVLLEAAPCFSSNALLLCAYGNPTIFAHRVENGGNRKKTVINGRFSKDTRLSTLSGKRVRLL
jgi:hypothetical protein